MSLCNLLIINSLISVIGTLGRNRTGTSVTSLVFETNASTNSATRANGDCF